MTVSIRSVLHNTQFKRADPVVEVEGKDLDMPVRWVFTNEREDVSSFLSAVRADYRGQRSARRRSARHARTIVARRAEAGVAALVVELVEGVVRMPDELASAARLHGLTLIGLKSRVPFVDICLSVNTAIVHEQMHLQLEVDTMSTSLREGLSRTGNIEAVAETIASLFGESVAIFDGDGLLAARAGRAFDAGNESSAVIALESRSRPVGALEITQRTMTSDATMRRAIATIVSPVAALYIDGGARMGMMHHLRWVRPTACTSIHLRRRKRMRCSKRWVLPDHASICHSLFGSDRWWKASTMYRRWSNGSKNGRDAPSPACWKVT